jgi:hypothetical protein
MKRRIAHLALALLAGLTFSSCGAANSLNQTAGRVLDSVSRTMGAAR